jgi:hypothetical protein
MAMDPTDEVAVYQLAQAQRALGQTSEMEKTLARFRQLRTKNSSASRRQCARPPA